MMGVKSQSNAKTSLISSDHSINVDRDDEGESSGNRRSPTTGGAQSFDRSEGISNFSTVMHIIKSNLGTGILAMPMAFHHSGWLFGAVGLLVLGFICVYCMQLLVKCSHILCQRHNAPAMDYADVADLSMKAHPRLRRFAFTARVVVNIFLITTQMGACCVYLLFIAKNIRLVVNQSGRPDLADPNYLVYYELILLALLIPYSYIRNIKYLAPFSTFANIANCVGLLVIGYFILIRTPLPSVDSRPLFAGWSQVPLYFGTAIYAFEGIGVVLPMENRMKDPKAFPSLFGVLSLGMTIVCSLYVAVGFYGYIQFGDKIKDSITLNMSGWEGIVVEVIFILCIFVCYGIQFYVPMSIITPWLHKTQLSSRFGVDLVDYVFRTLCVLFTFGIAAACKDALGPLISLIGALASSALALIFPPILETITLWPERQKHKYFKVIVFKNILIASFGVVGCVTGTEQSIVQLIKVIMKNE